MNSLEVIDLFGDRPDTLSPHLDDGVLSTGALQRRLVMARAKSHIVTVTSGAPPRKVTGEWNSFTTGEVFASDANLVRVYEDREAVRALGAYATHLGFYDEPYLEGSRDEEEIIQAMEAAFDAHGATSVNVPVGIYHPDHKMTSDLGIEAAKRAGHKKVIVYADAPYNYRYPEVFSQRLAALGRLGSLEELEPVTPPDNFDKVKFAEMYKSQFQPLLEDHGSLFIDALQAPERYWQLTF